MAFKDDVLKAKYVGSNGKEFVDMTNPVNGVPISVRLERLDNGGAYDFKFIERLNDKGFILGRPEKKVTKQRGE